LRPTVNRRARRAGNFCIFPRATTHAFQNAGDTPAKMLIMAQPAGIEDFFGEIDRATRDKTEVDMKLLLPIFAKHGMEFLRPAFRQKRASLVPIELCLKAPLHIYHPDHALGIFKHQAAGHRRNAVAPRRGNRSLERVLGMNRRLSGLCSS
jgi:hypothetical protein